MGSSNNLQEGRTEITCLAEGPDRARFTRHDRARPNTVKKDFII